MRRQKDFELKISTLEFIVSPIKISSTHYHGEKLFIEFDKGAQVLKKFDEEIVFQDSRKDYQFSGKEKGRFKLQSQRNSTCEWALYRFEGEEMSEFVDSLPANLHEFFMKYSESIKQRSIEYQHIISEKTQGREIWRQWQVLKEGLSWEFGNVQARSKSSDIQITFRVEIRCELDAISEQERRKSSVKSMKSIVQQNEKNTKKQAQDADDLQSKNAKAQEEPTQSKPNEEQPQSLQKSFEGYRINQSPPFTEPMHKQQSVLSDIIERSNQCSSKNKESKKGELKDITDIPEQQNELYSPLPNTKTQHFDTKFERSQSEAFKKRSNTFGSNKNVSLQEGEINLSSENKKFSSPEPQLSYDEQLQKEELGQLLTATPMSEITAQPSDLPNKSANLKGFIAIFILLIVITFAAYSQKSLLLPTEAPKTKRQKQKNGEVKKKSKKKSKEE